MSTLRFAQRLAKFTEAIQWKTYDGNGCQCGGQTWAYKSYERLLEHLIQLDEEYPDAGIPDILADAIDVYDQALAREREANRRSQARWEEEHAERKRIHELALTVGCPVCGQPVGSKCRTPSGIDKGRDDHKDRLRHAEHILDQGGA